MGSRFIQSPESEVFAQMRERIERLRSLLPTLSGPAAKKAMAELASIMEEIKDAYCELDPIKDPKVQFDPSNPDTAGRMVALAFISQDKVSLANIKPTYGSGVYAIYYDGNHPVYAPVSGTETPVYVGKADPQKTDARAPKEQGPQLYRRLSDHRRMITTVDNYAKEKGIAHRLRIEDFYCRSLVCASNTQFAAERLLIDIFRPIWNIEVGVCWGISKHGDAATTRSNQRSPWDVMHPGRLWALSESLEDKMTRDEITSKISSHFEKFPPYLGRSELVEKFLDSFNQKEIEK